MANRIKLIVLVLTIVFSSAVTQRVWADEATVSADECEPEVNITCDPWIEELCYYDDCGMCSALTTCDGDPIEGTYTWELNGKEVGTGNSIEICPGDLRDCDLHTLTVIDTTNDVTQSITVSTFSCCSDCFAYMSQDRYPKSHWIPLPALIEISAEAWGSRLTYECDSSGPLPSIIPLLRFNGLGDYPVKQLVIIMPAILTGNFRGQGEWCDVIIEDCAPGVGGFELDMLNFGPIPLSDRGR